MGIAGFDLLRQKQQQKTTADLQSSDDAIKRRFAAQGGLNTGAFVKMQDVNADKIRRAGDEAMGGINFQESQQQNQMDEAQKGRDFQSTEAQKNRDFQQQDYTFKDKVFAFDKESKLRQMDLADKQFALDKETTEFNKRLAEMEMNRPGGGLLGYGGFLGTGLGNGNFGGTVFCTELYRQGFLSPKAHKQAAIYGASILKKDPEMFFGYQIWAANVVALMQKHAWINRLMVPILKHWAMEITGKPNITGKTVLFIIKAVSKAVGVFHRLKTGYQGEQKNA
jgi:hypothetical protein